MRVRRNRRWLLPCIGPDEFAAEAKKIAGHPRGGRGQHRCKQHGQQLKALQRLRADRLQRIATGRILDQKPRLRGIERFIDAVGDSHRVPQHLAVFARCVIRAGRFGLHLRDRQPIGPVVLRLGRCRQLAREMLRNEIRGAARDVHVLPDEVAVDARHEIVGVEIEILDLAIELRGQVIAQPFRIEPKVEIDIGTDARAARLRHLLAGKRDEAVNENVVGHLVRRAGELEHRRPEQRMVIDDVLADEVVLVDVGILQELREIDAAIAQVRLETGEITDGGVEPDIEKLSGRIGDRNAEVRRVTRDVPISESLRLVLLAQPFARLVGDFRLQSAVLRPRAQKVDARGIG